MYLPSDPDMLLAFFPALTDTVFIICSSGQLQFDIPEEYFSSAVHAGCRAKFGIVRFDKMCYYI